MRVLESFSLWIIVLLWIHSVIPAVQYKFTFANDANKSGNTFTSNGAHITLNDSSAYVEIPEITSGLNARSKSGMIQLDASINANFDTHLNFASWIYYVGVVLYINFVNATYQSFFSMFVNLRFDSTTTWEPLWVWFMYSGVSSTNFYSYLYGTSFFEGRYLILNYPTTGWQYFGWHIENTISGTAAVNYHYISNFFIYENQE